MGLAHPKETTKEKRKMEVARCVCNFIFDFSTIVPRNVVFL